MKTISNALDEIGYDTELLTNRRNATAPAPTARTYDDSFDTDDVAATTRRPSVALGTFHSAKGLEWDTVFVVGVEEGYVPSTFATTRAQLEEEQRLFYVACTRARRRLVLSSAKGRTFGKSTRQREVSRFLAQVKPRKKKLSNKKRVNKISKIRDQLGASPIQSRTTQLENWRKLKARSSQVPEAAILSDQDLALIAESGPDSINTVLGNSSSKAARMGKYSREITAILS